MSFHLLETGKVHILVVAQRNLLSVLVDIGLRPVKVHHCPNISTYYHPDSLSDYDNTVR